MADVNDGVLTPSQRKQLQSAVQKCAACRSKLDYLAQLGHEDEELRARADHAQKLAEKALEIDRQSRLGS